MSQRICDGKMIGAIAFIFVFSSSCFSLAAVPASLKLHLTYRYLCVNQKDPDNGVPAPDQKNPLACADKDDYIVAKCVFSYSNGKPYKTDSMKQFQCDYLHAAANFTEHFNRTRPLASQIALLESDRESFAAAYDKYMADKAELLSEYAPTPNDREGFRNYFWIAAKKISQPFLWQKGTDNSYLQPAPTSWEPYLDAFKSGGDAINKRIIAADNAAIKKIQNQYSAAIETVAQAKNAGTDGRVVYDGGTAAQAGTNAGAGDGVLPDKKTASALVKKLVTDAGGQWSETAPVKFSPINVPPPSPPISQDDNADNEVDHGYFSRGVEAAAQRYEKTAEITAWHLLGLTHTVGHPYEAAAYNIHQKGPSCGVGAQYEALRTRGKNVSIEGLAKEAAKNKWYKESRAQSGDLVGGMNFEDTNKLLLAHGLLSSIVWKATDADIADSIAKGGGAIVSVDPRVFWDEPYLPVGPGHDVYVTGLEAETGNSGKILGYYVNDTGTGEGARFVPASDFDKAWDHTMVSLDPAASSGAALASGGTLKKETGSAGAL